MGTRKDDKRNDIIADRGRRQNRFLEPGPPAWMLEQGSFSGMAFATGQWGSEPITTSIPVHSVRMDGKGDPSLTGTAVMATELALGLAKNGPADVGYLTPTLALGVEALEDRLRHAGNEEFMSITHMDLA